MAQIDPQNPLESGLGSKIPWDESADPWDGNGNRWDGWPRAPHPAAFPTLKRRQPWVSALTVCHIAHKAARHAPCHPPAGEDIPCGGTATTPPKPHSEAGDPIGVEPSITAGEPWANPRTSPNQRWDPMGVQLHATVGAAQAHPRTARCRHLPRPRATHPRAGTTSG